MNSLNTFLSQSFKHFLRVGAFLPSSTRLAKRMAKEVSGQIILELGPGTGVITKEILRKMPQNGKLISIENNQVFVEYLKEKIIDSRLEICAGDAFNLKEILRERGLDKVDCIVSGLPLGNFTKIEKRKILAGIADCLKPDGSFIQFEYFLAGMIAIKSFFPDISLSYEAWNIPPAFVMRCKKNKK